MAIPLLTAAVGKEELDAHTAVFVAASVDCDSSPPFALRISSIRPVGKSDGAVEMLRRPVDIQNKKLILLSQIWHGEASAAACDGS